MMFSTSSAVLALVASASAHTLMSEIYIDGEAQGSGVCIRQPASAVGASSPIEDLTSTDMACGQQGETPVSRVCSVNGGSTISFEFREWADDVSKGPFDIGHKGPCAVYLKKVDDATTAGGAGAGWFKLWDEGYDESAGKWCMEKIIDNNGHLSISIPDTLQGGDYLVRSELLALHNAAMTPSDPQFYVGCTQVFLKSSGSVVPASSDTVSIPGYVAMGDASVSYNIYAQPLSLPYPLFGPSVFSAASSGVSNVQSTATEQTKGLKPSGWIVENANWYGFEVENYSTDSACWVQSAACWVQTKECYAKAPPTGSTGCKLMEDKCNNIDNLCNAGDHVGPPDAGKTLTPTIAAISLPAAVNGGSSYAANTAATSAAAKTSSAAAATSSAATSSAATYEDASEDSSEATSAAASSTSSVPSAYKVVESSTAAATAASSYEAVSSTSVAASAATTSAPAYTGSGSSDDSADAEDSDDSTDSEDSEDSEDSDDDTEDSDDSTQSSSTSRSRGRGRHTKTRVHTRVHTKFETSTTPSVATAVVTAEEYDVVTVAVTVSATPTPAGYKRSTHRHARRALRNAHVAM